MKTYVLKIAGIAGIAVKGMQDAIGTYVEEFDPARHNGLGHLKTTVNRNKAKHFESAEAALTFYQQISPVRPTRPDGQPNRPLTAYTMLVEPVVDFGTGPRRSN